MLPWCTAACRNVIMDSHFCEQIRVMEEDRYNNLGNLRARTANEILKAFGHVARLESSLQLPIYAHHGTHDRLADLQVWVEAPPILYETGKCNIDRTLSDYIILRTCTARPTS